SSPAFAASTRAPRGVARRGTRGTSCRSSRRPPGERRAARRRSSVEGGSSCRQRAHGEATGACRRARSCDTSRFDNRGVLGQAAAEVCKPRDGVLDGRTRGPQQACEVRGVAHDAVRLERTPMRRYERRAVEDANLVDPNTYLHAVANERVRNAVADRVDLDKRVVGHTPYELALAGSERTHRQRLQGLLLV